MLRSYQISGNIFHLVGDLRGGHQAGVKAQHIYSPAGHFLAHLYSLSNIGKAHPPVAAGILDGAFPSIAMIGDDQGVMFGRILFVFSLLLRRFIERASLTEAFSLFEIDDIETGLRNLRLWNKIPHIRLYAWNHALEFMKTHQGDG
jgi:hypothetical protein